MFVAPTLLNSCPILNNRMRQINILYPVEGPNPKNDILHVFKGKTKTKNSMGTQKPYLLNYFVTILRDGSVLTDDFVSHLSWVFTHSHFSWYNLGSLSKDHIRNTMPTRTKLISYLRFKTLKNNYNTLLHSTYQSSPYMWVSPLGIVYLVKSN